MTEQAELTRTDEPAFRPVLYAGTTWPNRFVATWVAAFDRLGMQWCEVNRKVVIARSEWQHYGNGRAANPSESSVAFPVQLGRVGFFDAVAKYPCPLTLEAAQRLSSMSGEPVYVAVGKPFVPDPAADPSHNEVVAIKGIGTVLRYRALLHNGIRATIGRPSGEVDFAAWQVLDAMEYAIDKIEQVS